MSEQMLFYVSIGAGVVVLVGTVAMGFGVWKMMSSVQKSGEQAVARQAADRGWMFETQSRNSDIDRRWTGVTDGISWRAEYRAINNMTDQYRRHEFRWAAAITDGPERPILLVHERSALAKLDDARKNTPAFVSGLVDSAIDMGTDQFFGRDAGARANMRQLQPVAGHGLDGFEVLAEAPTDALLVVERSLRGPLTGHTFPTGETPGVLLLSDGVHLALRLPVSTADLDGVVALGSALAAALKRPALG
jgi:hypothetical protein